VARLLDGLREAGALDQANQLPAAGGAAVLPRQAVMSAA